MDIRFGIGYDVHRLTPGRKLILGGVEVPHSLGLAGHSDADVLLHAVKDALLGAAGMGDIGKLFPVFFYKDRKFSERLALSIGMFTRGEVGAGVIFIALGYSLGGPALIISVLTIVLNLILTGIFVLWVKKLALLSYGSVTE